MKKIIALICSAVMLLALAACGNQPPSGLVLLNDTQPLVFFDEGLGVPVVNLYSEGATAINTEIAWWTRSPTPDSFSYFYAQHGGLLSLMLCGEAGDGTRTHFTWLLNTQTGELATNQDLLDAAGWDAEELRTNLRAKLEYFYAGQRDENGNLPDHARYYYDKMQAELNHPDAPRLFLHADSRLFWVSQLSFGNGLYMEEDTYYWAENFHEILIDPTLPDEAYAFTLGVLEHIGWDMLG